MSDAGFVKKSSYCPVPRRSRAHPLEWASNCSLETCL